MPNFLSVFGATLAMEVIAGRLRIALAPAFLIKERRVCLIVLSYENEISDFCSIAATL
jgi:hypothetical protein